MEAAYLPETLVMITMLHGITSKKKLTPSTLKMEAAGSSEMLVAIFEATRHHIQKDSNLFYPEDGGNVFLCNVSNAFPGYVVSQPRLQ
jgi:hypothetical protein